MAFSVELLLCADAKATKATETSAEVRILIGCVGIRVDRCCCRAIARCSVEKTGVNQARVGVVCLCQTRRCAGGDAKIYFFFSPGAARRGVGKLTKPCRGNTPQPSFPRLSVVHTSQ